jgi:selT/selW/selH-like putative selenoprotein
VSLASELERNGHEARATEGARSQFDVIVDGQLVFSKEREHRFPEPDEILAALG